jgi:VanZ family protein
VRYFISIAILLAIALIIVLAGLGRLPAFVTRLYAFPGGDKLGHFFVMGALAAGLNLLLLKRAPPKKLRFLHAGSLLALGVAGMEEISQALLRTRTFSLVDLGFSCLGILAIEALLWGRHTLDQNLREKASPKPDRE